MLFNRIYNSGVDIEDSYLLSFRTRVINLLTFFVSIHLLFWVIAFTAKGILFFGGVYCLIQLPLLSVIYFTSVRKFRIAAYLSFGSTLVITVFSLTHFGFGVQSQFLFPFLSLLVFILHERKIDWLINLFVLLISFFASFWYLYMYGPISEPMRIRYDTFINLSFVITMVR